MTNLLHDADARFDEIVDELTRRGFLGGAIVTAAAVGVSGCADASSRPKAQSGARRVRTIHGSIDVPAHPERVVAVSFIGTANLLDLGVTPVGGVTGGVEFLPKYKAVLDAMPIVADPAGSVDLEKVVSLEPDLIVGSDWANASQALLPYDKLRRIAPTALFPQAPSVGNWASQARGYADAVNQLDGLEPLRQELLAQQERIRSTHARLLGALRWEVVNAAKDGWYRYSTDASHCKVLAGAGFRFTAAAKGQKTAFAQLSFEEIGQLREASAIALGRSVDASWDASLTGQELFNRLPAVEEGHLARLKWFFPSSYGTALALLAQIEPTLATWHDLG